MYIADLHIHSKYSRATSRECVPEHLDLWARRKGIHILGSGDFTHPAWRQEMREKLTLSEEGLYVLKKDYKIRDSITADEMELRFVISGEISSIYKKNGKTRKVHNLILLPSLEDAENLSCRLEAVGNIHSDGRPILGLDSRDLLEITLETCPQSIFIPAHIWTPHFSLFGAFSGFDTIEECFEDLTEHIHALETGLSSDPPMIWRLSALDKYNLVSNSDAHSPGKLGREANLLDIPLSYTGLYNALQNGEGLEGTIEFFPEEGKYHMDGHRKCDLCLSPVETNEYGGRCPVCGKKITIGVLHRIEELADREEGYEKPGAGHFENLVPLPEVIAASTDKSAASVKVKRQYEAMLKELGTEFSILRDIPLEAIRSCAGPCIEEGIRRLREGKVERIPGFDGEYGKIKIIDKEEIEELCGQVSLFDSIALPAGNKKKEAKKTVKQAVSEPDKRSVSPGKNKEQEKAVTAGEGTVAVIAGPGTGKTHTLIQRISFLVKEKGVRPADITAVTFTNKAAQELEQRLLGLLGKEGAKDITAGTFHSICLNSLRKWNENRAIADEVQQKETAEIILKECGLSLTPGNFLRLVSVCKSGMAPEDPDLEQAAALYTQRLCENGFMDFDDLLLETLQHLKMHPEHGMGKNSWLLVDEFQDISPIQYRLIRQWSIGGKGLFAIGDPDQSVYGFRGSDAACFQRLMKDEPKAHLIRLTENYRSTPEILKCALALISHNPGAARILTATKPGGASVRLVTADSDWAEAIFIAKEINKMTGGMDMRDADQWGANNQKHRSFGDIAILYRTHRQAEILETCLRKESIPCTITGRGAFLEEPVIRNTAGFFRALLEGRKPDIEEIIRELFETNPQKTADLLTQYFSRRVMKDAPAALLEEWGQKTGLSGKKALKQLTEMAVFYDDMEHFLHNLLMGEEQDLKRNAAGDLYKSGAVSLMTLHGSKGLEFPAVFLCGIKDGCIPVKDGDLEEERRLFYVGMTRAREELILLTGERESQFLAEIPEDCFEREAAGRKKVSETTEQMNLFSKL